MVTRSKAGIFKPKALSIEAVAYEPSMVEEALADSAWRLPVQAEYDALINNSTWEIVPLPSGRKAIGCKWLFKINKNLDETITQRKARLVAKGCSQVPGCDFQETFSLVVKPAIIRTILFVVVSRGWQIRQVDVNNAFLNDDLTDEVYMQQPPGYVQFGPNKKLVCRLTKALYGLCQASRAWFDKLKKFLVCTGFLVSKSNASLFIRVTTEPILYVLVYVDNIIVTGSMAASITSFIQLLDKEFSLKDMGDLHYFLGIEVIRSSSGSLHLCQQKYIRELLDRSNLNNAKSVHTPMISSSALSKDEGDRLADPTEYRSLAGALQYVARLDIAYAVNRVYQFMHAPTTVHFVALKQILRYLRGTIDHGLIFRPSDRLSLVGYADANWGLDFDDSHSTTRYCVYFGHTLVSWCSKKQQTVSRSTAEAKYRSLAVATTVVANPVLHSKFKHVELDLFFVREKVAQDALAVGEVPACDQVADIFTKPLSVSLFARFRNLLRVLPIEKLGETSQVVIVSYILPVSFYNSTPTPSSAAAIEADASSSVRFF
ncbi:hypothetical protein CXB51_000600 [Gossypium anomalum]|uniref:Reverse transcriptase Ty1/copia-type domain-containing protein n=1 Tax=Gossypium anomalum TaxID=47600 RepID=A0A8J5ZRH6_9ROSI|nr:hypothetical protein CXB51_000600 [Gossypium anomalum]